MLNRKMSAGTAAEKCSKCSLFARPALLLAILMLVAVFCKAQDSTHKGLIALNDSSFKLITAGSGISLWSGSYGYHKTGKLDTVKAVLLITDCDNCQSKSVSAYAVREQSTYFGDRMPTQPPTDYSDYWSVKSYLDSRKKTFPSTVTIWDCRLK